MMTASRKNTAKRSVLGTWARPAVFLLFAKLSFISASPAFSETISFYGIQDGERYLNTDLVASITDWGRGDIEFTFLNLAGDTTRITSVDISGEDLLNGDPHPNPRKRSNGYRYGYLTETNALFNDVSMKASYVTKEQPGSYESWSAQAGEYPWSNDGLEYVSWIFALEAGVTYEDLISALNDGRLRLGISVTSGEGMMSRSTTGAPVPLPASILLLVSALGCVSLASLRRTRSA